MTLTSLVFFTTYIVTQFANFRRGTIFCFFFFFFPAWHPYYPLSDRRVKGLRGSHRFLFCPLHKLLQKWEGRRRLASTSTVAQTAAARPVT